MTRFGAAGTVLFGAGAAAAGTAEDDADGFRAAAACATGADFGADFVAGGCVAFGAAALTLDAAGLRGLAAALARFAFCARCCSMRCCSSAVQTF